MAQIPVQLIYKETEDRIVSAINDALSQGLPMFVIEPLLKMVHSEALTQANAQYQEQMQSYQTALAEEAKAAETSNEATGA